MFRLEKSFTFEASHRLPNHDGKCRRLHGHSWKATLIVEGDALQLEGPKSGMLIDYGDLGKAVKELVESHLDHWHLNDSTGIENPTSEALAVWIFAHVDQKLKEMGYAGMLKAVRVNETCTSAAEYRPSCYK